MLAMNVDQLHRKLIAAARECPPDPRVPLAFERRIMARLLAGQKLDFWAAWGGALWRAAAPSIALIILFGAWFLVAVDRSMPTDLSQDFERTVLAAADQEQQPADVLR